ncbi:S26 family signal peptidase [Microbispora sp. CA-135349]|uniref:S26 family signal peptidase n=1 Tax=Microbispora sp. CA-135349 TaxID=3239953 RepID=UPI003D8A2EB0
MAHPAQVRPILLSGVAVALSGLAVVARLRRAAHLVVLGDDPRSSPDSRRRGFVPADRVLGVVLRWLPPDHSR